MRAVNGCARNNVTRSEWKYVIEKEGTKVKKICLTNLVEKNVSLLSPHEHERVKVAQKASQALCTHTYSDFKEVIHMI